ncbi:hypothetical protein J4864_00860 [Prevotella multiformis]|uniref:DUF6043 family protein n=1 Tax=Prevotella multiformis TaxID=282402 RepID=UPI001BA4E4BB|nr:DUF6043 family protein [Prevotella multiformis]QUB70815.1 hypothetical protein J4864_00860 [Prevotella multiformis]
MKNNVQSANHLSPQQILKSWHQQHLSFYNKFLAEFNAMAKGDMSFMAKLFGLFLNHQPKEMVEVWEYMDDFVQNDFIAPKRIPAIVEKYDTMVDECLDGNILICLNLASCEAVALNTSDSYTPKADEFVIDVKWLDALFAHLPKTVRVYFNSLIDGMMKEYDASVGMTKEEMEASCRELVKLVAETYMVYCLLMVPKFLKSLLAQKDVEKDSIYSLYYFMIFDHGFIKMTSAAISNIDAANPNMEEQTLSDIAIKNLVQESILDGFEKKTEWKAIVKKEDEETGDFINSVLSHVRSTGGKAKDLRTLKELLTNDTPEMLKNIHCFVSENSETTALGCLYYLLQRTHALRPCNFKTFCSSVFVAMDMPEKDITKARQKYNKIKKHENALSEKLIRQYLLDKSQRKHEVNWDKGYFSEEWKSIRKIVNKWLPIFENTMSA